MSRLSNTRVMQRQSDLSLALSVLFFSGGFFALLGATAFPPPGGWPWWVNLCVCLASVGVGVAVLIVGRRLTLGTAAVVASAYIITNLLLVSVSVNAVRGTVSGLLIVVVIIFFAWFMPIWFTRAAAYTSLLGYAFLMVMRYSSQDTGFLVVAICVLSFAMIEVFGRFKINLQNSSLTDHLCKVWNRGGLEMMLSREIRNLPRNQAPLSMLFVDLDGFKRVNDAFGHLAGDSVLQKTAQALTAGVRPTDTVARIGGDEFVVVLPGTNSVQARTLAERLRTQVTACKWSYGVAEYREGETVFQFMDRSDRELIAWKQARHASRKHAEAAAAEAEAEVAVVDVSPPPTSAQAERTTQIADSRQHSMQK